MGSFGLGHERFNLIIPHISLPLLPLRSEDPNVTTQETVVKKVIEIRTQIKELHIKATYIREQAKKEFEEAVFGETQKVTN